MDGPLSRLEIDLDAVARNYSALEGMLAPGAACAAVVKTDAYGLGAAKVAGALSRQGCRHFFVATFDEGARLRETLDPAALVCVLHGPNGARPEDFTAQNLAPVLNTPEDIALWAAHAGRTGRRLPALLHFDTGMSRLGLSPAEAGRLDKAALAPLDILYVMSHLACADEPGNTKNEEQLALLQELLRGFPLPVKASFANSGGIFMGPRYHFDLARPGCALYGINPRPGAPNPMQGVVRLSARILQVRAIDRAGSVGYGAAHRISPPAKCATISAGYGDGYFRGLEGRGRVFIGGAACPVIGRISMDSIVADVTALDPPPKPGDWAQIIGPRQPADDVARQAGTIGYEVLTALGKRYERIYMGG